MVSGVLYWLIGFVGDGIYRISQFMFYRNSVSDIDIFTKVIYRDGLPHSIYVVAQNDHTIPLDDYRQELHRIDHRISEYELCKARLWAAERMASDLNLKDMLGFRYIAGGWVAHEKAK